MRHEDDGLAVRYALAPVAPGAGGLDGRLDRLGPGVHRQGPIKADQVGEFGAERPELVGMDGARGEGQPVQLAVGHLDQRGWR